MIRGAIYHVKGIYTYAFGSSSTRMALNFHVWLSLVSTPCTEVIPTLLLPPATLPDSTTERVGRGNAPAKNVTPCKTNSHLTFWYVTVPDCPTLFLKTSLQIYSDLPPIPLEYHRGLECCNKAALSSLESAFISSLSLLVRGKQPTTVQLPNLEKSATIY